jgi:hypothetical protein
MKKIFILLLFAAFGLLILFVVFNSRNKNQDIVITNFDFETRGISDKNLAQFYLWTQEDPLLTAPNFDEVAFSKAISSLEATEALYMKQFKLTNNIYPDNFLKDLINVNKAHEDFINNPTLTNAKNLIEIYKATVMDYESGINKLQVSIKSLIPADDKVDLNTIYFQGINSMTTLKTIIADSEKIKLNTDTLKQEISKRENCLNTGTGCVRPVNDYSNFELVNKTYNFSKKDILPMDLLYLGTDSARYNWEGPYIASSQCWGWSDESKVKPYLFYIMNNIDSTNIQNKYPPVLYKIATDRYYRELDPFEKKVYADKQKRTVQNETNNYMCQSHEYRIKLNSINYLIKNFKNKQIFSFALSLQTIPEDIRKFFLKGQDLEKKFFDAEFPSETDADNLVNYYGLLYKQILVWNQKSDYANQSWLVALSNQRQDILNVYLSYKRGLFDIDKQIMNSAYNLNALLVSRTFWDKEKVVVRPQGYVYMARSDWGLLYFPFSKSFYRSETPLEYVIKTKVDNVGPDKQYINYLYAIKHYSLKEIMSWYSRPKKLADLK